MMVVNYLLVMLLLALMDSVASIKILQYSETKLVKKGDTVVLFCR
jgi:hypothetical protein